MSGFHSGHGHSFGQSYSRLVRGWTMKFVFIFALMSIDWGGSSFWGVFSYDNSDPQSVLYYASSAAAGAAGEGCGESSTWKRMCCDGKNNTCRRNGARMNNMDANQTCFCDSPCLHLKDCCADYKTACLPVDCELASEWSEWEPCDVKCGIGVKQRQRKVLRHPLNGGKPCGARLEKAVCEGDSCKQPRASESLDEMKETAKIVPEMYGRWRTDRQYDPLHDVRRTLKISQNLSNAKVTRPSYFSDFEITDVQSPCLRRSPSSGSDDQWTQKLTKGTVVCVECQQTAMKWKIGGRCEGQGVFQRETRWTSIVKPGCRGKWVMKRKREKGSCPQNKKKMNFILI